MYDSDADRGSTTTITTRLSHPLKEDWPPPPLTAGFRATAMVDVPLVNDDGPLCNLTTVGCSRKNAFNGHTFNSGVRRHWNLRDNGQNGNHYGKNVPAVGKRGVMKNNFNVCL
ncbi:Hypothetical protein CINCED_3A020576 [Cinara cedri]|uniref:Uncharacterized protein n=1 Tax=Cinara cedri TaxID=506608 RepID=A0A5E4MAB7_9HEMI|nr:Hypothetical protein CINCED_3A020576 [Cinara cedri]